MEKLELFVQPERKRKTKNKGYNKLKQRSFGP